MLIKTHTSAAFEHTATIIQVGVSVTPVVGWFRAGLPDSTLVL